MNEHEVNVHNLKSWGVGILVLLGGILVFLFIVSGAAIAILEIIIGLAVAGIALSYFIVGWIVSQAVSPQQASEAVLWIQTNLPWLWTPFTDGDTLITYMRIWGTIVLWGTLAGGGTIMRYLLRK